MTTSRTSMPTLISPRRLLKPPPSSARVGVPAFGRFGVTPASDATPTPRHADTPIQVVLGIDPGLATTGWGVIEKNRQTVKLVSFGCILTAAKQSLPARLLAIQRELSVLI